MPALGNAVLQHIQRREQGFGRRVNARSRRGMDADLAAGAVIMRRGVMLMPQQGALCQHQQQGQWGQGTQVQALLQSMHKGRHRLRRTLYPENLRTFSTP